MFKFFTKYDLAPRIPRILDQHDEVDRLSYLDTCTQVKMFMQAGKNIAMHQKDAIYNLEEAEKDDAAFSTPVYKDDPVIAKAKVDAFKKSKSSVFEALSEDSANEMSDKDENSGLAKDKKDSSEANPPTGPAAA